MKYTDLVGSGYLIFNDSLSETGTDARNPTIFYDVREGYEIRVKGAKIGGLSRFVGGDNKEMTYVLEFTDYMGEGKSQFERVYLDEELEVVIYEVKRTVVAGG